MHFIQKYSEMLSNPFFLHFGDRRSLSSKPFVRKVTNVPAVKKTGRKDYIVTLASSDGKKEDNSAPPAAIDVGRRDGAAVVDTGMSTSPPR